MKLPSPIRTLIRYVFSRDTVVLKSSRRLSVDTTSLRHVNPDYGDFLIHPCVRFIPEGFAGHKWWMAVTPFPRIDDRFENPVLYYGEGYGTEPPRKWHFVDIVQPAYDRGYNADCNLFFDGLKLWILWKETDTPNTTAESNYNCVMGRSFDGRLFGPVKKFLDNPDCSSNRMTAPCVIQIAGDICLLATCYEMRTDDPVHPHGKSCLSLWKLEGGDMAGGRFVWQRDIPQDYPEWFDFWHADFFEHDGRYYCVVTNERATTVLSGVSDDGIHYVFSDKPLLSKTGNLYVGMYKASAVVVNGRFHLFFPRKSITGRRSRIYHSFLDIHELVLNFS